MSEDFEPTVFKALVGGYTGPSYGVRWEKQALFYDYAEYGYEWQEPVELHPLPEEWQRFWAALDRIGVWEWKPRYANEGIVDGTSWKVEIEYSGRRIESAGLNAYPSADRPGGKDPFNEFCIAVSRLIGGRAFR